MALSFSSNASNFVNCGTSATLNPASISVSAWVNPGSFGSEEWIIARDDNTLGRAFAFGLDAATSHLNFQANGTNNLSGLSPSAGVWSHCAVTGPGAAYIYYLNGASNTPGGSTAMGTATGALTIGKRTFSGFNGPWSGSIGPAAIWNAILTPVEITALSKGVSPLLIRPQSLIAFWPLKTPSTVQTDLSRGNNTAIINGSCPFVIDPPLLWNVPAIISGIKTPAATSVKPYPPFQLRAA